MIEDNRGLVLKDNVDLEFLKNLEPQFFSDYIKFVVNLEINQVCVGMSLHASSLISVPENKDNLLGGNIFFEDGHIEYNSTLNVNINTKNKKFKGNPRIITDQNLINRINLVLFAWVEL